MNLNAFNLGMPFKWLPPKILLIMKLIIVLMISFLMQVSAAGYGQKINIDKNNTSLKEVLENIKKQTGYVFFSKDYDLKQAKISVKLKDADIDEALEACLKGLPLSYKIVDKTVFVQLKEKTFLERVVATLNNTDASGRVVDSENRPLPGASVKVKKTGKGVSTDKDGRFFLRGVEEGAVLVVSFIGYLPKEVSASTNMGNVVLEQSLSKLDEVQVIAYGTTTQRLSTGNVTTIKADVIEKQPVNNPLLALQGRVPGLFIEQATGFAGTGVKVRIQGQNSILKGNDPFYVIDGVPFLSQLTSVRNSFIPDIQGNSTPGGISGNPLSFINPSDIESIDVLKDADATAIYGSRAANGAILITTKKGKSGETKVDLNLQTGIGQVVRKLKVLNTNQYLEMRNEALKNNGILIPRAYESDLNGVWDRTRNVDWQKELIGDNAQYHDLQASVSGGGNGTTFLIGTGYHRETNVFPGDFADTKGSIHVNINSSSTNQRFKIQFTGSYLTDNNKLPPVDLTLSAITLAPNSPEPYNPDGTLNWQPNEAGTTTYSNNPLAPFKKTYQNKTTNLVSNILLSYQFLKGLEFKSSFGFNTLNSDQIILYPTTSFQPEDLISGRGYSSFSTNVNKSWIVEPQLTYNRSISRGQLNLLIGSTVQQSTNNGQAILGSDYVSDLLLNDVRSAPNVTVLGSNNGVYKYNGLYGRLNYNWMNKYILNITARRDGSSNFGPENQFHNFGAIGAAWIFSESNFIKRFFPFLSQGKLRTSYGTTGSDQIGSYQFLNLYESLPTEIPYQGGQGLTSHELNNPYLQWEETRKLQIGLDLGLLMDRVILNVNYNRNRSSNQLIRLPLPIITGAVNIAYNLPVVVQNTGWELTVNSSNISSERFNWTSSFNITIPRNEIVSFHGTELESNNEFYLNQPISVRKVFQFAGVNQNTGLYQFIGSKGNIVPQPSDPDDLTKFINIDPKFYGGFQNHLSYKSFSVDILLQFVKQIGYDWTQTGYTLPGRFNQTPNVPVSILDRWQKPGDRATHQLFSTGGIASSSISAATKSDLMYKDASFVRLKNVAASWVLPEQWRKTLGMKNISLFVQGQNLFTITRYQGLDPESKGFGLPPLRTITIGAKITL
jgi:TonB-linked SusC/RagA family outer membrane protein